MIITILDTETTGFNKPEASVIEVALVKFSTEHNDVIDVRSFLVESATTIQKIESTKHIHGIHHELVFGYGISWEKAQELICTLITDSEAILAHNSEFDKKWFTRPEIFEKPWVCTQDDIEWPNKSGSKALVAVALAHGVGVVSAHRALDDVMTVAKLLKRVGESYDLEAMIRFGMRPKALYQALVSYNDKELARLAGFKWDAPTKTWTKRMAIEDALKLNFKIKEIK